MQHGFAGAGHQVALNFKDLAGSCEARWKEAYGVLMMASLQIRPGRGRRPVHRLHRVQAGALRVRRRGRVRRRRRGRPGRGLGVERAAGGRGGGSLAP